MRRKGGGGRKEMLGAVIACIATTATAVAAASTGNTPPTHSPVLNSGTLSWISLSDAAVANGAVCNDGSMPGFWASLSTDDAAATGLTLAEWAGQTAAAASTPPAWSRKWALYLPLGGMCLDHYSCELRAQDYPDRVSSRNNTGTIAGANLLSADRQTNPISFDHHRLYAHYCSSDFWLGRERGQNASDASPYAFQGLTIFRSLINDLLTASESTWLGSNATTFAAPSLADATEILLVGSSAGGIAALNHVTWLKETVQAEQRARWNATAAAAILAGAPAPPPLQLVQVRLVIDSGWFIDYESQLGELNRLGDLAWNLAGPSTALGMPDPLECVSEDFRVREVGVGSAIRLSDARPFGVICCFLANCMLNAGFLASDIPILVVQSLFDTFFLLLGESEQLGTLLPSLVPAVPGGLGSSTINNDAVQFAITALQRTSAYGASYNASFQLQRAASRNVHFVLLACFNHVFLPNLAERIEPSFGITHTVLDDRIWGTVTVPRRVGLGQNTTSESASLRDIIAKWHNQTANSTALAAVAQEPLHYTDWCNTPQCNPTCPDYTKFEPSSLTATLSDTSPFKTESQDRSIIEWACIVWIFFPALLQLLLWVHGRWNRRRDWRSMDVLAAQSKRRNGLAGGRGTDSHISMASLASITVGSATDSPKCDTSVVQLSFLGVHYWPQSIEGGISSNRTMISSSPASKSGLSSVVGQAHLSALSTTVLSGPTVLSSPVNQSPVESPHGPTVDSEMHWLVAQDSSDRVLHILPSQSQVELVGPEPAAFQTAIEAVTREEQQKRGSHRSQFSRAVFAVLERNAASKPPAAALPAEKVDLDRLRASSKLPSASFTAMTKSLLKGVNGSFSSGQMVALLGRSGCGKTTLLELLACRRTFGMVHGSMLINGHPLSECQAWVKANVGFVSQHGSSALPELTVLDNLLAAARLRLPVQWTHHAKLARVQTVIDMCGLGPMKHTIVGSNEGETGGLSGGQRRRVALSIELLAAPRLLMLDEITSGLDASSALEILLVLHSIVKSTNLCCVLSIHQPRMESWGLFDQVLVLDAGHMIFQGSPFAALPEFTKGIDEAAAWGLDQRDASKLLKISESAKDNKTGLDVPNSVNVADWLLDCLSFPAIARAMQQRYEREYRGKIVAQIEKDIQEASSKTSNDKRAADLALVKTAAVSLTPSESVRRNVLTVSTLESRRIQSMSLWRLSLNAVFYAGFGLGGTLLFFWRISSALHTSTWFVLITNCASQMISTPVLLVLYESMPIYLRERMSGAVTATQQFMALTLHMSAYVVLGSLCAWLPAFYFSSPLPTFDWGAFLTQSLLEMLCIKCVSTLFAICVWGLFQRMACAPLLTLGQFFVAAGFIFSGFLVPRQLMPDSLLWMMQANPMYWTFGAIVKIRLIQLIVWGDQQRYVTPSSTGSSCAEGVSGWNCMMQQIPSFDTHGNSPMTLRLVLDTYGLTNIDVHAHMLILLAISIGLTLFSWFILAIVWRVRAPVKCRLHEQQIACADAYREEQLVREFQAQRQAQSERLIELQKAQQAALDLMVSSLHLPPSSRCLSGAARWASVVRSHLSGGGAALVLELRNGGSDFAASHQTPDPQFLLQYAKAQVQAKRQAREFDRKARRGRFGSNKDSAPACFIPSNASNLNHSRPLPPFIVTPQVHGPPSSSSPPLDPSMRPIFMPTSS